MSIHTPSSHGNNLTNTSKSYSQNQNTITSIIQNIHQNLSLRFITLTNIEKQKIFDQGDTTTKNILTKEPQLIPTHQVHIDGIDFYFWPKVKHEDKILFFVNNNGRIEPRVARFSESGQKMHIFPGYDTKIITTPRWKRPTTNKRYSKGDMAWKMDYESGVIPDPRIELALNNISTTIKHNGFSFGNFLAVEWYLSENYETAESLKEFEKINISTETNPDNLVISLSDVRVVFWNLPPSEQESFFKNPINGMGHIFSHLALDAKIFKKFIENNGEFPKWGWGNCIRKARPNDEIQKWDIDVGEWNGKILYATICYNKNEPELCWVESFNIFGSPITSFGIPKHRVSGGLFTAKPAEYFSQIPRFLQEDMKRKNPDIDFDDEKIYDIREYLQKNPFIVAFKKLRETHKAYFI